MPEVIVMWVVTRGRSTSVDADGLRKRQRAAFTLLELLLVMGIMVLMMTAGVAGYLGMRRGAEMRGAVSMLRTTVMLARQQAVTKRHSVKVEFRRASDADVMQVVEISRSNTLVHPEMKLPPGIAFNPWPTNPIVFSPTGVAAGGGGGGFSYEIVLQERMASPGGNLQSVTSTVWVLTGLTTVDQE